MSEVEVVVCFLFYADVVVCIFWKFDRIILVLDEVDKNPIMARLVLRRLNFSSPVLGGLAVEGLVLSGLLLVIFGVSNKVCWPIIELVGWRCNIWDLLSMLA